MGSHHSLVSMIREVIISMRLIPEQDLHAGIKMYRKNPNLSYEAVAKLHNFSATTLRRKNLEAIAKQWCSETCADWWRAIFCRFRNLSL